MLVCIIYRSIYLCMCLCMYVCISIGEFLFYSLMFSQMRMGIEQLACNPRCPTIVSRFLTGFVSFVARLAPGTQTQAAS